MKILLINPPFTLISGIEGHGGKTAPINLAYLTSYLLKYAKFKFDIRILDAEGLRINQTRIKNYIQEWKPDVVGITMTSPVYNSTRNILQNIKAIKKEIVTVVGGPHPSAFKNKLLKQMIEIDFAIVGEGEESFLQLVTAIKNKTELNTIPGLVYRKNNEIIFNSNQVYIKDIDTIPFPARHLLPMDIYYPSSAKSISFKGGFTNIFSSRGCLYNCTYCSSHNIWQKKVRLRSAKNVVDEIEECVSNGITRFNFNDDIFPISKKRTLEICSEIIERKLNIRWTCMTRADFIWKDIMIAMKKAGCDTINLGLESGSDVILESIKKKTTVSKGYEAVKIAKSTGLKVMGNFMFGNIGETEETIKQTIKYSLSLNLDSAGYFITMPFPGTELFDRAVKLGYMKPGWSYDDLVAVGDKESPLCLPDLPPSILRAYQAEAIRQFYLRPSFILKSLYNIRSVSDFTTLLQGFKLFVNIFTKILLSKKRQK